MHEYDLMRLLYITLILLALLVVAVIAVYAAALSCWVAMPVKPNKSEPVTVVGKPPEPIEIVVEVSYHQDDPILCPVDPRGCWNFKT